MRGSWMVCKASLGLLGLLFFALASACSNNNTTCQTDGDCKATEICKDGKCEEKSSKPCTKSEECTGEQVCKEGKCEDSATCKGDSDCTGEQVCKEGKCEEKSSKPCTKKEDCTEGKVCKEGKCEDSAGCSVDADCTGDKKRCETKSKACVACLADGDCQADQACKQNACEAKQTSGLPGCGDDSACTDASVPKCDVSRRVCVECLADGDCKDSAKSKCVYGTCRPGCNPACGSGEYCFNGLRCFPKVEFCPFFRCSAGYKCVSTGTDQLCLLPCDPTQNKSADDPSNSACWGGFGHCNPSSRTNPNRGVCIQPMDKSRHLRESCEDLSAPDKPNYHGCQDGLVCVQEGLLRNCWKKCDPKKNAGGDATKNGINPDCKTADGEGVCEVQSDGSGACDPRLPKRAKGESCKRQDLTSPGFHDCKEGLFCVEGRNQMGACHETCDPNAPSTCGADYHCTKGNLCLGKCDPAKGVVKTSACPDGFFCLASTEYPPGHCNALPDKESGSLQLGAPCSLGGGRQCDGRAGLFCLSGNTKCVKACNPRKDDPLSPVCGDNEMCVEDARSFLGGGCVPKT